MEKLNPLFDLAGRIFMALLFIPAGAGKISGYAGTQGYMESVGVPGILLPLVIIVELGGGIAILLGWQTRIVAFLLAGFCLVSALLFHFQPADQMQMILFMKNIAIAGGLLFLVANGAGALSIDRWRQKS
ncbi:DoxX family protein [uncultured Sneathiella sp.]|uniref:DoxX family protein n=1 Tax=uncultured Sneathiella sp. TaxID=879315 RepID=UPI0030EE2A4D|tara:strand:+ start:1586 stop:1975 length:390 start_codon:yes stop_codon:yes gene_type:complete